MSAPLALTAAELKAMSDFLVGLTALTSETGCVAVGYSGLTVQMRDASNGLQVEWDADEGAYVVADRTGD